MDINFQNQASIEVMGWQNLSEHCKKLGQEAGVFLSIQV